jgi:hypothetical protein
VWRPSIQGEEQGLSSAFGVKAGWILFNGKFQSKLHFVALVDAD